VFICFIFRRACHDGHIIKFGNSYRRDIKSIVEGKPRQLIESVAEDIAKTILTGYPTVTSVQVRLRKPHVAVHGVLDALGVEITRSRID
jgi:dihydroneopterin aldolase